MAMTNITIKIDSELALSAKVLAARRGTSLSRLVADQIRSLVNQDQTWLAAQQNALRRLKRGYDLEWEATSSRDELHEREMLR
jgi:predicted transcriptional regulator